MSITSILVVNMNYLGDALMTTPAIRALKRKYSTAKIDVIAGATRSYGALEILSMDPDIDKLIPRVDGGSLARGWQLFRVINHGRYDLVVVLPSIPFYNSIASLFKGLKVVSVPKARQDVHMADHMLNVLSKHLLDMTPDRQMIIDVPVEAQNQANSVLSSLNQGKKLVVLNVGASRPQKRWPSTYFAKAAELFLRSGKNVVLTGGGNEQDQLTSSLIADHLTKLGLANESEFVNLVGKTSLEDLSGIICKGNVIVTADTGAMHIAAALKVPIVALFGSTISNFTGPYGGSQNVVLDLKLSCAPCGTHPTCGGTYDCMSGITPQHVMDAVDVLLPNLEKVGYSAA